MYKPVNQAPPQSTRARTTSSRVLRRTRAACRESSPASPRGKWVLCAEGKRRVVYPRRLLLLWSLLASSSPPGHRRHAHEGPLPDTPHPSVPGPRGRGVQEIGEGHDGELQYAWGAGRGRQVSPSPVRPLPVIITTC